MRVRGTAEVRGGTFTLLALSAVLFGVATQLPDVSNSLTQLFDPRGESTTQQEDQLPVLQLRVAIRDYMLLESLRQEALQRGILFRSDKDMVPALLSHNGHHERVSVRLKGDFIDHFDSSKWSWRVHVGGEGQVLGLRRFSLQAPQTRGFQFEALLLSHLRAEGLLAPRYELVNLWVNGRDQGVMALEEHFSKELLEAQGRREGVIVRFDEDEFWQDRNRNDAILGVGKVKPEMDYSWRAARIRPFREKVIAKSPLLEQQTTAAIGMLRALQASAVAPSAIFDVEAIGEFLAVYDFWGYWHGLRWHNFRFYLNPVTFRLEPIGFDSTSLKPMTRSVFRTQLVIFARVLLADPQIYSAYRRHLGRLMDRDYLNRAIPRFTQEEEKFVSQLRPEYHVSETAKRHLSQRVASFSSREITILSPKEVARDRFSGRETGPVLGELPYAVVVHANLIEESPDRAVLELSTVLHEDVQVTQLTLGSKTIGRPLADVASVELPLTLGASSIERVPQIVRIAVPHSLLDHADLISGEAVAPSQPDRVYAFTAQNYVQRTGDTVLPDEDSLAELLLRFPFLKWDGSAFRIPSGSWTITEPLIIPRRLDLGDGDRRIERPALHIASGTQLRFERGAFLLSYGACEARGSAEHPITLTGQPATPWKGLAILGAVQPSVFEHVIIENTDATGLGPWRLTGGTTFYETQVTLSQVKIVGSRAEDAINIVRSTFALDGVTVSGTHSDALDVDFSQGRIENSSFADVGGDAIDLSGSQVFARNLVVSKVHDKGISVGEKSALELEDVRLQEVGTAIVSKDLSEVVATRVDLRRIELAAFMAYNKKPEYGPGSLRVSAIEFDDSAKLGVVQYGSLISVDGAEISESHVDVDSLYATGLMQKWW